MDKARFAAISSVAVCSMFVLALAPTESSAADIKEIVVKAGSFDRVCCPIRVTCETPIAVAAVRSLKTPDGKQQLPAQVGHTEEGSVITFVAPRLAANQTLHLVPSRERVPGGQVVLTRAGENQIDIKVGGSLLTSYCYPRDSEKPYLYPVIGPKGTRLTRGFPMEDIPHEKAARAQDHAHHRSLWVAHGEVNGGDFWAITKDRQRTDEIAVVESGAVYGRLVAKNSWMKRDGTRAVSEEREYVFYNTPEEGRLIDSIVTFMATDGDATFGDTKEGGICALRLNPNIDEEHGNGVMRNAAGGRGARECWGKRAAWCDYYGTLDGQVVGIAVFDYPTNLRHPTWWHIRDYGLYTANCFGLHNFDRNLGDNEHAGDYLLKAGKSLTFRYRLLLHAGDTDEAKVADRYADFVKPPKVTIVWEK